MSRIRRKEKNAIRSKQHKEEKISWRERHVWKNRQEKRGHSDSSQMNEHKCRIISRRGNTRRKKEMLTLLTRIAYCYSLLLFFRFL